MLNSSVRKILFSVAMCAAAGLGAAGPAQAAVYKGAWDPDFGGNPFPNLNWSGEALFTIPTDCITYGMSRPGAHTCSTATMDSAQVDLADPGLGSSLLDFTGPVTGLTLTFAVSGELLSVGSGYFNPVVATTFHDGEYEFTIMFFNGSTNPVRLFYQRLGSDGHDDDECEDDGQSHANDSRMGDSDKERQRHKKDSCKKHSEKDRQWVASDSSESDFDHFGCAVPSATIVPGNNTLNCGVSYVATKNLVFTLVQDVPEPPTYALMLAGLGAVGFMARRRRR
jgi:hypothetical protein